MRARRHNPRHRAAARAAAVLAAVMCVAALGCAYYNTLYNAKARFRDAAVQERDRDGAVTRQTVAAYDEVVVKCRKMIATWPDSRHVDDAMLLMARSYEASDRFEECVGVLDTLETQFPDTELLGSAWAVKGAAYARWGRHAEAVDVLTKYVEKHSPRADVLYNLCTSLMSADRSDEAVKYLSVLEEKFSKSDETLDARVTIAEILAEKGQYENSRAVYERLDAQRIPETVRYRVWMGYARVDVQLRRFGDALATLSQMQQLVLTPEDEPPMLLVRADALAGADSLDAAIGTYGRVASRFSRGEYGAEAHYRLGLIYEGMDSLQTAKSHFDEVPRAYANSDYARDSIKRSNSIAQLIRLEQSAGDANPDAMASREFALAELQLLQFENPAKALEAYQKLLVDYPDTAYGPKAAYAIGYIYGVVLADTTLAWEAYRFLIGRYPQSQQAANAGQFVATLGAAPAGVAPPPEFVPPPDVVPGADADTTGADADTTGADADTTGADADTTGADADSTGADADSTEGEGE